MATMTRSKVFQGSTAELTVTFYGFDGAPVNADSTPTISIADPLSNVVISTTSVGIENPSEGVYKYFYDLSTTAERGLWKDTWSGTVDGSRTINEFTFLVVSESSAIPEGNIRLGDEVSFDFSQEELVGLNILLKFLKARLRSSGRKPRRDLYGAFVYDAYGELITDECNVFSDEILATFLCQSLSEFNSTPFFTSYTFAEEIIYKFFANLIVEGAYVVALASQSLVEKGRDFTISDGGISYQPPQLGDFLSSHYQQWLSTYRDRLKFTKNSIRPNSATFGTFTSLTSANPQVSKLRHLRARRIL